ncbi:MAG: class I SAM-dependent methyltransferase [Gammaproteobacteria bacterium]|nr:class I SAM-dependent methyltransferase [Gammaproteobacteria bacterium]
MSSNKPKTDRLLAASADEFIWDTSEHTEVHKFVLDPVLSILKQHQCISVLDIGCGNGSFTGLLATHGYQAKGIDHSLSGIEMAKQHNDNLMFEQHDITLPLDDSYQSRYDAAISIEVIEHLLLPRKLIENAYYSLKPGGVFILTTPFHGYWKNLALALTNSFDEHWHPLRDYGHIKFFSKSTITALFDEYKFKDIGFTTVGRIPPLARSMIIWGIK